MTADSPARELTLRSIVLGGLLTLLFTAANVYFGLKVGSTFATSLPAAVISMAVLRGFGDNSLVENNITQTIASAAGAVATMIFVLPGLVMIGWWQDFPYWTTTLVCFLGGTLGVMMSVPLRRALVTGSDLPYPEGLAGAEVLRIGGSGEGGAAENRFGLQTIVFGGLLGAGYGLLTALKLVAGELARTFKLGATASGAASSLSMGLMGVGHLIGLSAGIAMATGLVISVGMLLPWQVSLHGIDGTLDDVVGAVFAKNVRFVGAGAIGLAAIWTLLKLLAPIAKGIQAIFAAQTARRAGEELVLTERDLPGSIVAGTTLLCFLPIAWLLWRFVQGGPVAENFPLTLAATIVFIIVIGAIVSAVTGYMAGLVGTSNSPVSGVGILSVVVAALLVAVLFPGLRSVDDTKALVAFALFITAFVFGIAVIANDNLQDLKTGQLVGSTPWKQQVALVIGIGFGSLVMSPVLDLINHSFGFAGAPGAGPNALAAPQASLISSLAQGVLGGTLRWDLIGVGVAIAAAVIAVDELVLAPRNGLRLPPLGVAMGIYLPMSLTFPTIIGAVIGHLWDKRAQRSSRPEFLKRSGVLLATGMIVGDSLFGLFFAGSVATLGENPLAIVGPGFAPIAEIAGPAVFAALLWWAYSRTRRQADATL